jgi:hypothetical protein
MAWFPAEDAPEVDASRLRVRENQRLALKIGLIVPILDKALRI